MKQISKQDFFAKKRSDTIIVYGSGYSINDITADQMDKLQCYDSIAMNWFCKSNIPTTFYLLRDQACGNSTSGETRIEFEDSIKKSYSQSCLIVSDLSSSGEWWPDSFPYWKKQNLEQYSNDGVIFREIFAKRNFPFIYNRGGYRDQNIKNINFDNLVAEYSSRDPFTVGIIYFFCTISSIMHIINFLDYKRILFIGVDLYDHRYFWLPQDTTRASTLTKGRKVNEKHYVADKTIRLLEAYKKRHNMYYGIINPKSMLNSISDIIVI